MCDTMWRLSQYGREDRKFNEVGNGGKARDKAAAAE
jgi:hypothetical protein